MRRYLFILTGSEGLVALVQLHPIVNFFRRIDTQCTLEGHTISRSSPLALFQVGRMVANFCPATFIDKTIYVDGVRAIFTTYDDTGKDIVVTGLEKVLTAEDHLHTQSP